MNDWPMADVEAFRKWERSADKYPSSSYLAWKSGMTYDEYVYQMENAATPLRSGVYFPYKTKGSWDKLPDPSRDWLLNIFGKHADFWLIVMGFLIAAIALALALIPLMAWRGLF